MRTEIYKNVMNIFSIITSISLMLSSAQVISVLMLDKKSRLNQLFALIGLCITIWLFSAMIGYSATDLETVQKSASLSALGYTFLHAFFLHFTLLLTGYIDKLKKLVFLIYIPSFYFFYEGFYNTFIFDHFLRFNNYWIGFPAFASIKFRIFIINYVLYYVSSLILLVIWKRNTKSKRNKKQANIIILSLFLTIFLYNFEPFIVPLLFNFNTFILSPNASIILITGLWIAIVRYRLFFYENYDLVRDVFNSINYSIFVINEKNIIIKANNAAHNLLQYSLDEILNKSITEFSVKPMLGKDIFSNVNDLTTKEFLLKDKNGIVHNISFKVRPVFDKFKDFHGHLLIGEEDLSMEDLILKYNLTKAESKVLKYLLAGHKYAEISVLEGISINTVKSHITHIYNKFGINSKMDLLNLLKDYSDQNIKVFKKK